MLPIFCRLASEACTYYVPGNSYIVWSKSSVDINLSITNTDDGNNIIINRRISIIPRGIQFAGHYDGQKRWMAGWRAYPLERNAE